MLDDPLLLARIQFAFTIGFHIVFPGLSIGLASYLAVLQVLYRVTGREVFDRAWRFWLAPFTIIFGMGVVSGIVMSYQFGTNWSVFSDKTGPVLGPLMAYEVFTAFFLEAGFLGIMLFGRDRVGPGLHLFATLMVAVGTLASAFWILAANSWMQTPAGYAVNDAGQFVPADWWRIIFNPSFPYRFVHMVLAAYLSTAFMVGATGAFHLLRDRRNDTALLMFSMAMWMAAVVAPLQGLAGDLLGLNTFEHQPMKVAAMEGHFESLRGAPLILFGWPDMAAATVRGAVSIPRLGSLMLTHRLDGEVKGLAEIPRADWPHVPTVFWCFRIMVGVGVAMVGLGLWSLWRRWRGGLRDAHWLQRATVLMGPSGLLALLTGWFVTEIGRQPWTVYGLMRTSRSVSPIAAPAVATSLAAFIVVYVAVFGVGIIYLLRLLGRTPGTAPEDHAPGLTRAAGITPAPSVAAGAAGASGRQR